MSLEIQPDPPAAEVQILRCRYDAACRARSCRAPAAFIARYLNGQGYFLRQFELCPQHTDRLQARDEARRLRLIDYRHE
jgi:hypothetical protein